MTAAWHSSFPARNILGALALVLPLMGAPQAALAQAPDVEPCTGLVSQRTLPVMKAAMVQPGEVGVTFIGHSTFLIESPGGVRIATDYNDYVKPNVIPDVVTMNRAHSTHYTDAPNPAIKHVLRGWSETGGQARHNLSVGDVMIRSVPTNIRSFSGTDEFGNSIFVFEAAGLCVAHLGHLHHELLPGHLKLLGRIDVLLVPVDGGYTMDIDGMLAVMEKINAPLMIPMHYFGQATLERFLTRVGQRFAIERNPTNELIVSRATLPQTPKVLVLPGR